MFAKQRPIPFEPLEEAAKLAWDKAPDLCGPGCMAYHRTWSLTRLLSAGGVAPAGAGFYANGLTDARALDAPRVLISGGADTGLMALAVQSMGDAAARTEFVFADICATPGAQNTMMAAQLGLKLTTIQTDILALDIAPVDAILSHSFVSFLPREKRKDLVAVWADHLRPGGVALVTSSVAAKDGQARKPKDPARLDARAQRLGKLATEWGMAARDVAVFEALLREDPMPRSLEGHWTEAQFRAAFDAAGLALDLVAFDAAKTTAGPLNALPQKDRNTRVGFQARKLATP